MLLKLLFVLDWQSEYALELTSHSKPFGQNINKWLPRAELLALYKPA